MIDYEKFYQNAEKINRNAKHMAFVFTGFIIFCGSILLVLFGHLFIFLVH